MQVVTKYREFHGLLNAYLVEHAPSYFGGYFTKEQARENVQEHVRMAIREYFRLLNAGETFDRANEYALGTLFANLSPLPEDYYFDEFLDNHYPWFFQFFHDLEDANQKTIRRELMVKLKPVLRMGFEMSLADNHHLIDDQLRMITENFFMHHLSASLVSEKTKRIDL